jgi:hypothetical protein
MLLAGSGGSSETELVSVDPISGQQLAQSVLAQWGSPACYVACYAAIVVPAVPVLLCVAVWRAELSSGRSGGVYTCGARLCHVPAAL